jgi:chromate reductase
VNHYQIVVLVGSLRKDSLNRQLASAIQAMAPDEFTFEQLRIDDLPPYNQDDDAKPAAAVRRLKGKIAVAQGVLFVTPEYNRSLPGVLKNAIDHASRPYGKSVWEGKPAGVVGASIGAPGSSMAQQHLRNILAYLDAPTLGQPEMFIHATPGFFDKNGTVADEESRKFIQSWVDKYVAWVKQHQPVVAQETAPAPQDLVAAPSRKKREQANTAALKSHPGGKIDTRAMTRATAGKRWSARKTH